MADKIVEPPGSHEPTEYAKTPKKAAASGWIGSALEYYDFFIYAQAAALVFPTLFFPSDNAQVGIVASFATFGVGYVARPIGAFVLGHWGDTHGRKNVLVLCMLLIGASTFGVALLPTYAAVGIWAPILLVILRLIQGFAVGGEISGASAMIIEHSPFGRRGYYGSFTLQGVQAGQILAAAVFLPLSAIMPKEAFQSWGWRIPFLLSAFVVLAGYHDPPKTSTRPRPSRRRPCTARCPSRPIVMAVKENGGDMFRVFCMALMNAVPTAVTDLRRHVRDQRGLRRRPDLDELPVDLGVRQHRRGHPHPVRRQPVRRDRPASGDHRRLPRFRAAGLPVPLLRQRRPTCSMSFFFAILMWGMVYQGYNAVFPAFFQELFPTKTRVTGVRGLAEPRHDGHRLPAGDLRGLVGPTPSSLRGGQEVRSRTSCWTPARPAGRRPTRSRSTWSGPSAASPLRWPSSPRSLLQCPGDLPGAHERSG